MEELQSTTFKTVFRGYDKDSVHRYIQNTNEQFTSAKEAAESIIRNQNQTIEDLTARNKELEERVISIESKKTALYAVAEQTLSAAKAKAAELTATSEQAAADLTQKTKEETDALRKETEEAVFVMRKSAQEETDALRRTTQEETDAAKKQAEEEAARLLAQAKQQADQLIADAQRKAEQLHTQSDSYAKDHLTALSQAYNNFGARFNEEIQSVIEKVRSEIAQEQARLLAALTEESPL